ncbi:MAG: efflux transporter periplasmic adaptor subunit [Proteobacteria bacterium]|nr:MAG: efflux transporter periplasmic adaptor subunit [Pseudomonadota bacterium]
MRCRKWQRVWVFIGVAMLCSLVILVALSEQPDTPVTLQDQHRQTAVMPVSVRVVEPESYPAIIKSFGEVVPQWQTTIRAEVGGSIRFLSDNLRVGNRVKQGELLVQLEKSEFEMHVAEAKSRLAAAKVALLTEQREAKQAQKDWQHANINRQPDSPLVLRTPQLKAAEADVKAAQSALKRAEVLLHYTKVVAPFDGVITQRKVSLGDTLNGGFNGGEVATLYNLDVAEVAVQLDQSQWALLPEPQAQQAVRLYTPQRDAQWPAEIVRKSFHLDSESRLRTLFIRVQRPLAQTPALLPGTFVEVEIVGRNIDNLIEIPEPALTKQGMVWFVDNQNRLQPRRVKPVFYGEGVVYLHTPSGIDTPIRVAQSPNARFVSGLSVSPKTIVGEGQ